MSEFKNGDIVSKAWGLNLSKIPEFWYYDNVICNAGTRGEAKSKLLSMPDVYDLILNDGEKVTFLNIPVARKKEFDKVMYNGEVITRNSMKSIIELEKHEIELDKILLDNSITHCYIKKRGQYYQDNYNGYTDYVIAAGIYPKEDAVNHGRRTLELSIVPIDNKAHNEYLQNHINAVSARLIK
ncbi:hypothetical protein HZP35_18850 [Elizabethkingia anophelis]|nr:hypothetical protein [Elizabethkingia anophelis]MCT4171318.1 hypothetical protein [Elizabethkingia anophelis]MCT4245732.1 hypothetical protein [Elizabethkingia anophelis]MCT4249436.1 hypothetical protein [Elizabethkingia anophelis]MCT4260453.1 hypothetical protein [Elizabethkingia anophelis]